MILVPCFPCDVPRQSGGSTQIPFLTGYETFKKNCQKRIDAMERVRRTMTQCSSEYDGLNASVRISRAAHEDGGQRALRSMLWTRIEGDRTRVVLSLSLRLLARGTNTYQSNPRSLEPDFGHSDFSRSKIKNGYAQFLVHLGNSSNEDSIRSVWSCATRFWRRNKETGMLVLHSSLLWTRMQVISTRSTVTWIAIMTELTSLIFKQLRNYKIFVPKEIGMLL